LELHDTVFRIVDEDGEILKVVARTSIREVIQHKAQGRQARASG
jgi:hypothetical protein